MVIVPNKEEGEQVFTELIAPDQLKLLFNGWIAPWLASEHVHPVEGPGFVCVVGPSKKNSKATNKMPQVTTSKLCSFSAAKARC